MMLRLLLMLIASVGLLPPAWAESPGAMRKRTFHSEARDVTTRRLRYTETHTETYRGDRIVHLETLYKGPDGKTFASRALDFPGNVWAPMYRFEDLRSGLIEQVTPAGKSVEIRLRPKAGAPFKTNRIDMSDDLAIDAGFDQFIRVNAAALAAGKTLQLRFVVPSQLDAYRFTVSSRSGKDAAGRLPVQLAIANRLLRLFVSEMDAVYTIEPFALVAYDGVSNMRDDEGELMKNISIRYPVPASAAPWVELSASNAATTQTQPAEVQRR